MNFKNLAANATTVIANRGAKLHTVTINTVGSASNVLTLYDNASAASGTKIGTFDTTDEPSTLIFDCDTVNGIVAIMGTGTAADITITWE